MQLLPPTKSLALSNDHGVDTRQRKFMRRVESDNLGSMQIPQKGILIGGKLTSQRLALQSF